MTDAQQTIPIAAELKAIKAIASALALELATRLNELSHECDRQLDVAKTISSRGV